MQLPSNYKVITAWDTNDGFNLVVKDAKGKRKVVRNKFTEWYFYIPLADYQRDDIQTCLRKYGSENVLHRIVIGKKYVRIYSSRPTKENVTIDMLRKSLEKLNCQVYEFDVHKHKRFMIDNDVPIEDNYKVLYFDIETDDSVGGIVVGRDRIISWAAKDSSGKEYYEQGDEKTILAKFIKVIEKYDIITGWNSEFFDLPYIQIRAEHYGLKYNWRTIMHVDMFQRCFKIFGYEAPILGLRNFSLNEVSKIFLGEEKVEHTGMKIWEMERDNPELLKEYNKKDVELLYQLDTKLSIIPLMIQECVWTGTFLNKFYIGEILDNYILREAKKRNIILASKSMYVPKEERVTAKIVGGYVMEPIKGYYKNVQVCDFKSLYPSIIIGWNIGADSINHELSHIGHQNLKDMLGDRKIEDVSFKEWHQFLQEQKVLLDPNDEYIQTANNAFFARAINSFIGDLVSNLLHERAEYKKKLKVLDFDTKEYNNTYAAERVVKEMANSMFGITAEQSSRHFDKYVCEGITYTGQYLNKLSSYIARDSGLTTVYGDTDSVFVIDSVDMNQDIVTINENMKVFLDTHIKLRQNIVYLEYEKMFGQLLILAKKRYSGFLTMKDGKDFHKLWSKGTEDVKKSYIVFGKEKFKEVVQMVFNGSDENTFIEYVLQLKEDVLEGRVDNSKLLITTKVSKDPTKYKNKLIHVRLAERLIKEEKLLPIVESEKKVGARLEYLIVDDNGKNEAVLLDELDGSINKEYYWEKQIFPPLRRVLDVVFPEHNWKQYSQKPRKPRKSKKDEEQLSILDTIK